MNFIKQYSTVLSFIGIVLALYLGYVWLFAPSTEPVVEVTQAATAPDQELVALLFELKNIRLDSTLFEDPLFKSLRDFGRDLVSEPVGRNNPFAPLTGDKVLPPVKKTP